VFARAGRDYPALNDDITRPLLHVPRHPLKLTRFGLRAALPATVLTKAFRTPQAKALFGGVAAHAIAPLTRPLSSAIGAAMVAVCHANGWPVARGGSRAVTDALAAHVSDHGGAVVTGTAVRSLSDLPAADAVVFDLAPRLVAEICGERLPGRVARAYRG